MRFLLLVICLCMFATSAKANEKEARQAFSDKNYKLALKLHLVEAQKGNADSQYYLGIMFQDGLGTQPDPQKAKHWYEQGAQQGDRLSIFNLVLMNFYGKGLLLIAEAADMGLQMAIDFMEDITDEKRDQ